MNGRSPFKSGTLPHLRYIVLAWAASFTVGAEAIAPRLEIEARIQDAAGTVVQRSVAPGAVLSSGDDVRMRVTAAGDGYLYVVVVGASGAAVVLHPFDGPAEPVRGGESVSVPGDGGFLPLDSRTGRETVLAFVAARPLESITRVLVLLEARAKEGGDLREVLTSQGVEPAQFEFGHAPAPVVATVAAGIPAPATGTSPMPPAAPAAASEQSGVLSGLGSRIAQFTGVASAESPVSARPNVTLPPRPAPAEDPPAPSGGIISGLAGLFGLGGDSGPGRAATETNPDPPPANTFPLESTPGPQIPPGAAPRETSAPRLASVAATDSPPVVKGPQSAVPSPAVSAGDGPQSGDAPSVGSGRFVAPLAVESTLRPLDSDQAAIAPASAPQEGAEVAPRPGSSVAGTLARLFGPEEGVADAPGRQDAGSGDAPPMAPGLSTLMPADAPSVPLPGTAARPPGAASAPAQTAVEVAGSSTPVATVAASEAPVAPPGPAAASAGSASTAPVDEGPGLLAGLASLFGGGETQSESAARPDAQVTAAPDAVPAPDVKPPPAADAAGVSATKSVVPVTPVAPASQTPVVAEAVQAEREPEVLSAAGSRLPPLTARERATRPEAAPVPGETRPDTTGPEATQGESGERGLLAGLGALFSGGARSTKEPEPVTATPVEAPTPADPVSPAAAEAPGAVEQPAPTVAPLPVPPKEKPVETGTPTSGGGLLAGLGSLFGGGSAGSSEAETKPEPMPAPATKPEPESIAVAPPPAPAAPPAPAPAVPAQEARAGSSGGLFSALGALFGAGSDDAARDKPVEMPAPAARSPERVNTGMEPTLSRRVDEGGRTVVVLEGAPAPRVGNPDVLSESGSRIRAMLNEPEPAAPARAPVPDSSAAPIQIAAAPAPAPPVAAVVAPDPVQNALAAGGAVSTQSRAPTQVALLAAAPARTIAQTAEPLASVDLEGSSGVAGAVVLVVSPQGPTSGVLVDGRGHVLTNWHSVRGYDSVIVFFKQAGGIGPANSTRTRAQVVGHSKFTDLALLKVDAVPAGISPPGIVARVEVDSGSPIHAIGQGDDGNWRHSVARVDQLRRNSSWYSTRRVLHRGDVIRAEMQAPQDISGAPLFNNRLELVGLGAMVRMDKGELIGVSAGTIRAFLSGSG